MSNAEVKVWDLFVRIFHWTLVIAFTVAYLTGDDAGRVHEWSGYAVLALISARFFWGFVGPRHARFADFVYGPSVILRYSVGLLTGHPTRYLGHNPLGGLMVVALLTLLLLTSVTGIIALAPGTSVSVSPVATAQANDEDRKHKRKKESVAEELHEVVADATLFLVGLHILGVFVSGWRHRENLVAAMFTGRKRANPP
jgi:cytochrome b